MAGGPGGVEIGRVSVKVVPDTSGFARRLKAELAKVQKMEIDIPVKPDLKGFNEKIKKEIAKQKLRVSNIPIGANTAQFSAQVVAAKKAASKPAAKIPVDPIEKNFRKQVRSLVDKTVKDITANVPLTPDGEQLLRDAKGLIADIEASLNPISVPLNPGEAAKARAEILRRVEALQLLVDTRPVEVPVTVNSKSTARLRKDLGGIRSSLAGIFRPALQASGGLSLFNRETGRLRGVANNVSPLLLGLGSTFILMVPQVLSLVASLGDLVGIVAFLPSALLAVAAPLGVLIGSLKGLGDAFTLGQKPAELAKNLKGLPKPVQEAARAFQTLEKPLKGLQTTLRESLFAGLAPQITALGGTIETLEPALRAVSDGLNDIALGVLKVVNSQPATVALGTAFANIGTLLSNLQPGIDAVVRAFLTLAQVGSTYFPALGTSLSGLLIRFNEFVQGAAEDGSLRSWIDRALVGFQELGSVISSLYGIFKGLASAAQAAGGSTLSSLAGTLTRIRDVVNSPAFQTGLTNIFTGLNNFSAGIGNAFGPIGDAIAAVSPAIKDFLTALGNIGGSVLTTFANAITILAPQINDLAASALPVVTSLFEKLGPVIEKIATAVSESTPLFALLAVSFGLLLGPIPAIIAAVLLLIANFQSIKTVLMPVITYVQSFIPLFKQFGQSIMESLGQAKPVIMDIVNMFRANFPQIKQIVVQAFSTIRSIVETVLTVVSVYVKNAVTLIRSAWTILGPITKAAFSAILTIIQGVLNVIQGVFRAVTAGLKGDWRSFGSALGQIARGMWQVVKGIFQGAVGILVAAVKSIVSGIKNEFQGAVGQMAGIGRAIVSGVADGIRGAIGAVRDAAAAIANAVPDKVKGLLGISSPSRVMRTLGRYVTEGFADGIKGTAKQVTIAARALRRRLEDAFYAKKISKDQYKDALSLLTRQTKRLVALANARKDLAKDLENAKKKLADAIKQKADFKKQVRDSIASFTDITKGVPTDGTLTAKKLILDLKNRAKAVANYNKVLLKLKKMGLNKETFAQLIAAGVETGGATAQALLAGGQSAIKQVNSIQKDIAKSGKTLANTAGNYLYDAGIQAAKGLVEGLEKIDLSKASARIAKQLIAALKKELKISSPSRLMRDEIGVPSGEGIIEGLLKTRRNINSAISGMIEQAQNTSQRGVAARERPAVFIESMYAVDPDEAARRIELRQRDVNAVYSLGGVA